MIKRPIQIALFCLSLAACDGDKSAYSVTEAKLTSRIIPSQEEIITALYDSGYAVPDTFFVDERVDTPETYSLYHLKDPSSSYELCTDDFDQARQWENTDNNERAVSGYYVGSYQNGKYFEFIRELNYPNGVGNVPGATSPGFARVFKCSNINRNGVDRNLRNGFAGILNERPLSLGTVREFSEYMWQFVFFETSQRKVLRTYSTELQTTLEHTLLLGFIVNQGTGRCDRIDVVDWIFSADTSNGQVSKEFLLLFSFEARVVDSVPELC